MVNAVFFHGLQRLCDGGRSRNRKLCWRADVGDWQVNPFLPTFARSSGTILLKCAEAATTTAAVHRLLELGVGSLAVFGRNGRRLRQLGDIAHPATSERFG